MYSYKRIMVGLDFTPMDKTLIEYVSFLAKLIKPEKVYFVNAQPGLEHPEDWLEEFPELDEPIDDKLRGEIDEEVKQYYKAVEGVEIESLILEGSPTEELHDYVTIKHIDLLVVGRKLSLKGSGTIPQKLARKVPASILFVSQDSSPKLDKIVAAIDFSKNSQMALEEAIELARVRKTNEGISIVHTFRLPLGYYKTGKSEEEFAEIMKTNAQKKYTGFINDIDRKGIDISVAYIRNKELDTYEVINNFAHEQQADLIVIGGRGRTNAAALFLGSTVERLISVDMDIPLLVVKDKKATFGLLELLKKL